MLDRNLPALDGNTFGIWKTMKHITLRFFATLADTMGESRLDCQVDHQLRTIADLMDWLKESYPALAHYSGRILMARNQKFATEADPVSDGDEIALFPPVSGG